MNKQLTIISIDGIEPYNVYICDDTYNMCVYVTTINDSDLPYNFLVPEPYNNLTSVGIKLIDNNNCEIKLIVSIE